MSNMQGVQYIEILTHDMKHREYQWKVGLNEIDVFNNTNDCTPNALYVCEIKDFFTWMSIYPNMAYVGYVTIPNDAQIVVMDNKVKTNKVILHDQLIKLVDFIDIAIKHGADIHTNNDEALLRASYHGHLDVVKCLISNGADVHAENDNALINASSNGHLDVVEYLILHGANIHALNDYALCWISYYGYTAVLELLIKHGAVLGNALNY